LLKNKLNLSAGLLNLASLARFSSDKIHCHFEAGSHAILVHHPVYEDLRYAIHDGTNRKELLNSLSVFCQPLKQSFSIWTTLRDYFEIPLTDGVRTLVTGATVCAEPKKKQESDGRFVISRAQLSVTTPGRSYKDKFNELRNSLECDNDDCFSLYKCEIDGISVGHMTIYYDQQFLGIYDLAVLPAYANRGIGSALLNYARNLAIERQADAVVAQVSNDVLDFYLHSGFHAEESIVAEYIQHSQ
jgi:hypothetical protein